MERRWILFLVLSFGILLLHFWLTPKPPPPPPKQAQKQVAAKEGEKAGGNAAEKKKAEPKPAAKEPAAKAAEKPKKPAPAIQAQPQPKVPEQWVTLGSANDEDPYRMLVTLTNKGAAVARIELSSPFYRDIDCRNGYLGHLVMDPRAAGKGCRIQVVGPGTPAAKAGLLPGDVINLFGGKDVADYESLEALLAKTKPNRKVEIGFVRGDKQMKTTVTLTRIPLEVIKPENDDPLSMLLTLEQFDDQKISDDEKAEKAKWDAEDKDRKKGTDAEELQLKDTRHLGLIRHEFAGVNLRTANWTRVKTDKNVVRFRYTLPDKNLEITKTYRLAEVPAEAQKDESCKAYHLEFEIEIRNIATEPGQSHKVAYRLDGPNGLPTEGAWYASRVTRCGGMGLREFIISMGDQTPEMQDSVKIAGDKDLPVRPDTPPDKMLTFIGVDAQYFSAVLMPERKNPEEVLFEELMPIRVGKVDPKQPKLTNTSCRLVSKVKELKPGEKLTHKFTFFAGPKKTAVVKPYGLGELIYFGWFSMVAEPLTHILHWFFAVVGNYGLAIILLTIFVRGCMFPLSLKQAAGAQKMQMLQPELKKLQEKHKGNAEARTKAQQELFRKHNYNPLAGCLPIFIQMPVFIGLYRALMVAIELRDAPLFTHSIRWCSNLAAPDMLWDWRILGWPPWFIEGGSTFALGPYFNLLPLLTIVLFIVQQKMFMPPATDPQTATTQKMMKYMMIFMGVMFFKVASGLCIYFIASSLWGLAERRFLPKAAPVAAAGGSETRADVKAREREIAERDRKQREKEKKGKK